MSKGKVSVIITARQEPYIRETLDDIMTRAVGDIEIILVLDGDVPDYELPDDKRIRVYRNSRFKDCVPASMPRLAWRVANIS